VIKKCNNIVTKENKMHKLRNAATHLRSTHQLQPLNYVPKYIKLFFFYKKKVHYIISTNKGVICVISNKSNFNKVNISQIINRKQFSIWPKYSHSTTQRAFEKGDAQYFSTGKHMIFVRNAFGIQHAVK